MSSLGYDDDLLYEQRQAVSLRPAKSASRPLKVRFLVENRKLHYRTTFQDIPVSVENRKGSIRRGKDPDGEDWETKMKHPYGYIPGTEGADGDALDVFTGPSKNAAYAYVIHSNNPETGEFDEDKVMLGFNSSQRAKEVFMQHYDDPKFFGGIDRIPMWKFRQKIWVKKHTTKRLVASRNGFRESYGFSMKSLVHPTKPDTGGQANIFEGGPGSGPKEQIEKAGGIYRGSIEHPTKGTIHQFDDPGAKHKSTLAMYEKDITSPDAVKSRMAAKRKEFGESRRSRESGIYYARPMQFYESQEEDDDIDFLEEEFNGEDLIIPRACESGGDKDMSKYHREVDKADAVVFRPFRRSHGVHRVTAGVFSEAQHALHRGIPVRMLVKGKLHEVKGFKVRSPARADGDFADVILKRSRRHGRL